jgi:peroxiredoxin
MTQHDHKPNRVLRHLSALLALCVTLVLIQPAVADPHDLIGEHAPDFALRSAAGNNIRLSEYHPDVIVLNFHATWCGNCERVLDELVGLQAEHADAGLQVLTVAVQGDDELARSGRQLEGAFVLLDSEQRVSRLYDIRRLPLTLLIDREGRVRQVYDQRDGSPGEVTANAVALLRE